MVNPYNDNDKEGDTFIRTFECGTEEEELVWHRDRGNRQVKVKSGIGWELQMDNELPVELIPHHIYWIEAKKFHRLIKGSGNLVLEIREVD